MFKKAAVVLLSGLFLASTTLVSASSAAAVVKNGVKCTKKSAVSTVKVKGVSKTYICTINPAAAGNPNIAKSGLTWTLKTCVTYYAAYKANAKSISDQRDLVNIMSEPDKTTYTKELDKSQADLVKVLAAIETGHCKTGL